MYNEDKKSIIKECLRDLYYRLYLKFRLYEDYDDYDYSWEDDDDV